MTVSYSSRKEKCVVASKLVEVESKKVISDITDAVVSGAARRLWLISQEAWHPPAPPRPQPEFENLQPWPKERRDPDPSPTLKKAKE